MRRSRSTVNWLAATTAALVTAATTAVVAAAPAAVAAATPAASAAVAAAPASAALAGSSAVIAAAVPPTVQFTNPIVEQRADPHVHRHTDGYYYFVATVPEYDRIVMRRATTLQGLATAAERVIWRKHSTGEMGAHIWAPELHFIDGRWYIHFAAGRAEDIWAIRPYVLESSAANPLDGPWIERGQIQPPRPGFSLDATTFVHNGVRYLAWAEYAGNNSNIYLARMVNPWTYTGTPVMISTPTYAWETRGYRVNEGPAVIIRNGRVFMTYSASATDANYAVGLLTASAGSNLLNASSWTKSPNPVLASNSRTGQWGPGHNSFTVAEDGSDVIVYHSRNYERYLGNGYDPLNDPNRRTRVQKIYWNADGTPNFGVPVPDGATPIRLSAHDQPGRYLRHWEYRVRLEANVANLADSQFRVVPGLANSAGISLESTNFPGYYLRHRNHQIWVEANDGSNLFRQDATFMARAGLADVGKLSLESVNYPGQYVRHRDGLLYLEAVPDAAGRASATFALS
ncbi:family 43 glycosylhydrolase [Solwaraspora sp. WMMD792]|uniref:family 43 glycosylhydrolase n=1 Tax=Solwaraspora sp. WMMD792 TaxID=3016099 RepID=UPI002415A5AD|nr:family 43 glycosylhydrolase [Solwaraspora sp. WMMD792]MDG4773207.1 family 43 glycosylhydrolase [Solwaraspora sp. WMMD792]